LLHAGRSPVVGFEIAYLSLDDYFPPRLTRQPQRCTRAPCASPRSCRAHDDKIVRAQTGVRSALRLLIATYGLTLAICLLNDNGGPLFIITALSLTGAAALVPWSARWQAALSAAARAAMGVSALTPSTAGSQAAYRSLGVVVTVILGTSSLRCASVTGPN